MHSVVTAAQEAWDLMLCGGTVRTVVKYVRRYTAGENRVEPQVCIELRVVQKHANISDNSD